MIRRVQLEGWIVAEDDAGEVSIELEGWPPLPEEEEEAKKEGKKATGRKRQRISCSDEELDELRAVLVAMERLNHTEQ